LQRKAVIDHVYANCVRAGGDVRMRRYIARAAGVCVCGGMHGLFDAFAPAGRFGGDGGVAAHRVHLRYRAVVHLRGVVHHIRLVLVNRVGRGPLRDDINRPGRLDVHIVLQIRRIRAGHEHGVVAAVKRGRRDLHGGQLAAVIRQRGPLICNAVHRRRHRLCVIFGENRNIVVVLDEGLVRQAGFVKFLRCHRNRDDVAVACGHRD